jgi:hypothetical protein
MLDAVLAFPCQKGSGSELGAVVSSNLLRVASEGGDPV